MLLAFIDPEKTRIALPVALAVGYAAYHWLRWRIEHPKAVGETWPAQADVGIPEQGVAEPPEKTVAPGQDSERKPQAAAAEAGTGPRRPTDKVSRRHSHPVPSGFGLYEYESLARIYQRARAGDSRCFVTLGKDAWNRGALVEAHFWVSLATFNGIEGLDAWLRNIRLCWIQAGRPLELENEYAQFSYDRAALARAWMMMACGFNVHVNRDFISKMEQSGSADAKLILASLK